jgi:hypothetical protein
MEITGTLQHTAGPWTARLAGTTGLRWRINTSDNRSLAELRNDPRMTGVQTDEVDANALLIAAAPELLEALEQTRDDIYMYLEWARRNGKSNSELKRIGSCIDAAIAKATGQDTDL